MIFIEPVLEQIAEAAARSGRAANAVKLVAVTKYSSLNDGLIDDLIAQNCFDFGEARPQSLWEKAAHFRSFPIQWHLIGPLQRNKIRKVLPDVSMIHSLDSFHLAESIDRIAEEENRKSPVRCLVEVAISNDANKQGVLPQNLDQLLDQIAALRHIQIDGLMGMSGLDSNDDDRRRQFAAMKTLAEKKQLPELSMGMSDDFQIAIEEGATIVRLGSILTRFI
ncbi:MAG: YggS family pyridoxal phosphate-dependent enzyme [Thermoguttaceae bacterium]